MAKYTVFFGTYSKGEGNGLFRGEFDSESGEILIKYTVDVENPSYLQLSGDILYGVSEIWQDGGLVSIDLQDNKIISAQKTNSSLPCHLCVTAGSIFVANYATGSLSIFETDKSGNIKPSCQSIHHFGKSVNPDRQKQSYVHSATLTPDNKYLAVCDLGMDKVFLYPYSKEHRLSTNAKTIDCLPGSGPRHLTFSNDGEYLYVLTEMGNTVLVYKYNCGEVEFLQEISMLPVSFTGSSTAAAIHISPDGKILGASNRGHDSIALFKIQDNGELAFSSHIMTGKEPRDFRFSPDGKWLLTANQSGDSITVFRFEADNFIKSNDITLPKPVCILFGEEIK